MDDQTWDLLKSADWESITCGLLRYTQKKVQRRYWVRSWEELPKGQQIEDIAYEAIARVLSGSLDDGKLRGRLKGKRAWNPVEHPDLFGFLCDVVDSLIYHLVHSWENRELVPLPEDTNQLQNLPALTEDCIESEMVAQEAADELIELVSAEKDQELMTVLEQVWDGKTKASEIATATGIPVARIYRINEKLKRLGERLRSDFTQTTKEGGRA